MQYLYKQKGLEYEPEKIGSENEAYEELAEVVRQHLDLEKLYRIIGL